MAGPGMISLSRTANYCSKLADEVMKLRGEKFFFDFKILVKDYEFPCAKFVMAVHSPMLRAMLTSDMAEVAKQEIRLDHIRKDIIQIVLDYMYCEDVSVHKDQLMDLIAAADYLQMAELKQMGLDEVPDILEPGTVISWWKEAAKKNYDSIKERCDVMIVENFKHISQETDFLNLDFNQMQHYISDICSDTVNSDDIIDAIMKWVGHEEERVPYFEDLLNQVQLNKCSAEGIQACMKNHESVLDKTPMVYKLLLKTLVDTVMAAPKTSCGTQTSPKNVHFAVLHNDTCSICKHSYTNPQRLNKCNHRFCKGCIEDYFKKNEPKCPTCGKKGIIRGNQPEGGTMTSNELLVFSTNNIEIQYNIPDGIQGPSHPHPGERYQGIIFTARLCDDDKGRKMLKLLERAFEARLTFTIGQDNKVALNIEHYTDFVGLFTTLYHVEYLQRVQEQLAAKGIK